MQSLRTSKKSRSFFLCFRSIILFSIFFHTILFTTLNEAVEWNFLKIYFFTMSKSKQMWSRWQVKSEFYKQLVIAFGVDQVIRGTKSWCWRVNSGLSQKEPISPLLSGMGPFPFVQELPRYIFRSYWVAQFKPKKCDKWKPS